MLARSNSVSTPARPRPRQAQADVSGRPDEPAAKRQQAKAAALEAYHRAKSTQQTAPQYVKPTLERRRSRASGRTEGGHFEEARLGRRKSGKTRNEATGFRKPRSSQLPSSEAGSAISTEPRGGEVIVTRKRSVIPPGSSYAIPDSSSSAMPSSKRDARLSRSEYTNGSPLPRYSVTGHEAIKRYHSAAPIARARTSEYHSDPVSAFSNFDSSGPAVTTDASSTRPERSDKTDDFLIAQARDRCLQDFQQKKVRERKSTIFASLSKLHSSEVQKSRSDGFGNRLPPFNHAGDEHSVTYVPPPPAISQLPVYTIPVHERKSRNFTESLKGRFKKAFGRTSRVMTALPPQHVEGKTFHFTTITPSSGCPVRSAKDEDPFTGPGDQPEAPNSRADSVISKHTADTTAKSRMTSWTNSTVAGTWSTLSEVTNEEAADEQGRLKRSDSLSTLRKAKSFFGRPIQNRLRKSSKLDLRASDESSELYTALQERIHPPQPAGQPSSIDEVSTSHHSSALLTLPSQQQRDGLARRSSARQTVTTIRTVTPDLHAYHLNVPSPVAEVLSPDIVAPAVSDSSTKTNTSDTPRSQLQRRPAVKAPTPSKDLIARRIERSQHRWQGPLDEMSPSTFPKANRSAVDDNPYDLRSLSRAIQQPPAASDFLPHHVRVSAEVAELPSRAEAVMSPSVYSRATDEPSPRPHTPVQLGGTMVTVTGREVRSYSISPQKAAEKTERRTQASSDWRRWLSDEWKGWNATTAQSESLSLPQTLMQKNSATDEPPTSTPQQSLVEDAASRPDSSSPPLTVPILNRQPQHPRPRSSRSSFMNERYPMVDTGRNSTDARKISSRGSSRPSSAEPSAQIANALSNVGGKSSVASTSSVARPTSVIYNKSRTVSNYCSMIGLTDPTEFNDLTTQSASSALAPPDAPAAVLRATKTNRQVKSTLWLHAAYKNKSTGLTRTLPITRTVTIQNHPQPQPHARSSPLHILEDTTIRNISAGPYASSHPTSSSPHVVNAWRDENTPPPPLAPSARENREGDGLPSVSSSEWLAAGGMTKKERVAPNARRASRGSPTRKVTEGSSPAAGSPGQRLATDWLVGRRSKEGTPAFV